jgi:hypothetical protein
MKPSYGPEQGTSCFAVAEEISWLLLAFSLLLSTYAIQDEVVNDYFLG